MSDTVVVTGGLGRSGRWICDHLAGEYHVVCVDLDHPAGKSRRGSTSISKPLT